MIGIVYGLSAALTWGIGNVCVKSQVGKLSAPQLMAARSMAGAPVAVAAAVLLYEGDAQSIFNGGGWAALLGAVLLGYIGADLLFVHALSYISLSRAFPIQASYPLLAILLAWLLLGEQMTPAGIAGALIVVVAVSLIGQSETAESGPSPVRMRAKGLILSVISALCWGAAAVLLEIGLASQDAVVANAVISVLIAVAFLFLSRPAHAVPVLRQDHSIILVLIVAGALGGTGVANLLYLLSISTAGVGRASVLISSAPVFSALLAVLLLNEKMNLKLALGTFLSFIGVALIVGG